MKAVVKPEDDYISYMKADISFEKDGKTFTLHTSCFGDTTFCKGQLDYDYENPVLMEKYNHKTIKADYHENREDGETMSFFSPFFYRDLDFDGVEELIIVHYSMAERYHSGYDVYRMADGKPVLIDYPPYKTNDGFGMTDYPEFDYQQKTIKCPYPEGPGGLGLTGCTIYGISKTQKDTVVVNGRKHLYNHMEQIEEIIYKDGEE